MKTEHIYLRQLEIEVEICIGTFGVEVKDEFP